MLFSHHTFMDSTFFKTNTQLPRTKLFNNYDNNDDDKTEYFLVVRRKEGRWQDFIIK